MPAFFFGTVDCAGGAAGLGEDPKERAFLRQGKGRIYPLGCMNAAFKADHGETDSAYCFPECGWSRGHRDRAPIPTRKISSFLCAHRRGWQGRLEAPAGSFVRIPVTVMHDLDNQTDECAGFLNVFPPAVSRRTCLPSSNALRTACVCSARLQTCASGHRRLQPRLVAQSVYLRARRPISPRPRRIAPPVRRG